MSNDVRPIIIKRKKVIEGGHHGGAWKVAYADFVTAMMAFFMLMWLLNATTETQRKGLADYFSPSVPISKLSGGGDGALSGDSVTADDLLTKQGRGGIAATDANGTAEEDGELETLADAIMGRGGESLLEDQELRHVAVRTTDEGLVIEMFDLPGAPLFDGAVPRPVLLGLLASVAPELRAMPNGIAVEAFVAAEPLVTRAPTVWPVSSARAMAMRAALTPAGIAQARVMRVTGHADRRPVVSDPTAVRNNRVELIVLRRDL